ALIATSDALASFRVLDSSTGTADEDIEAELKRQLPQQSDRMSLRRTDVLPGRGLRTIYAVIWDRGQVQAMAETARHAGLEPAVVELKSLCVARAIAAPSCILLDMTGEPCEAVLIDEHVPRVSHVFTIGSGGDLPPRRAPPGQGRDEPAGGSRSGAERAREDAPRMRPALHGHSPPRRLAPPPEPAPGLTGDPGPCAQPGPGLTPRGLGQTLYLGL